MMNYSEEHGEANNCDKNLMTDTGMVALCSHSCHIYANLCASVNARVRKNNGTANNDTHSKGYTDKSLLSIFICLFFSPSGLCPVGLSAYSQKLEKKLITLLSIQ